jgi:hypothetical protein
MIKKISYFNIKEVRERCALACAQVTALVSSFGMTALECAPIGCQKMRPFASFTIANKGNERGK